MQVTSGDVQLAVRTWGAPGNGPAIVLVHGYPDTSHIWDDLAVALAPRHHVIAYDVRGAGDSSTPAHERDYALAYLVGDLQAVIDATCTTPVHLVGHDWGSIQSWEAATEPGGLGGRLRSLTSMSGPCLDHVGHWLRTQPRRVVARQLLRSWYVGAFQLPGMRTLARAVGGRRRREASNGISLYRANVPARLREPGARTTQLPVQLVVATRDPFVDVRLLDGIERWAPRTTRREVDTDHWGVLADVERLAGWLTDWTTRVERGA